MTSSNESYPRPEPKDEFATPQDMTAEGQAAAAAGHLFYWMREHHLAYPAFEVLSTNKTSAEIIPYASADVPDDPGQSLPHAS